MIDSASAVTETSCAQIQSLNQKIVELKGIKRPSLKRVKKTADDMLGAYSDTSKLMKADFKVNLKTVKKEDDKVKMLAETISSKPSTSMSTVFSTSLVQREEVTDWRKNVEAMSGMEGRKKLFDAGQ